MSPGQCPAIIIPPPNEVGGGILVWTSAGLLSIGILGTNFGEIVIKIQTFSVTKMHLKVSSGKWRPFWLGLNVLTVNVDKDNP